MTQTDKEKLRMAKNLVKANNKKIEKVLGILEEEIKFYVIRWNEFRGLTATTTWAEASRFKRIKELLEDLKEILEK